MIHVGIDLGVSGAMTAIGPRGVVVQDLPIIVSDAGKRLDARTFVHMLHELIPPNDVGQIVAENVRVVQFGHQMSHATETTLVGIRFAVHAAADIARIPVRFVEPRTWKKHYGLAADKAAARDIACRLYPAAAPLLKRVKDHNRAESLLIAHYAKDMLA